MKVAKAIRKRRDELGWSQADLAERLGVAASTVAGWEVGAHDVRFARLAKLARVLKTTIAELLA